MAVTFRSVEVETCSTDRDGLLVFDDERLMAILIRLSDIHDDDSGAWFLEYGPALNPRVQTFESLELALSSVAKAAANG